MGGSTGTSTVGGSVGSSAPKASGSSAPTVGGSVSNSAPKAGASGSQASYPPPPIAYYTPSNPSSSSNPFYTPNPQPSPFKANQAYGVQNSGSLSGGGKGTTNAMASPKADFSNPTVNRAATVPVPKAPKEDPAVADAWSAYDAFSTDPDNAPYAAKPTTARPASSTAPDPSKIKQPLNPLAPARTDENGTYNSSGQRLNRNDDGGYSLYNNENARGGAIKGQNSDKHVKKLTKSELDRIMSALAMALHVVNNRKE